MDLGPLLLYEKEGRALKLCVCVHSYVQEWLVWFLSFVSKLLLIAPLCAWVATPHVSAAWDQICHSTAENSETQNLPEAQ